jgi:hypothetical protein
MTRYAQAEHDWIALLETEATSRGMDFEIPDGDNAFVIDGRIVGRTRATLRQGNPVALSVDDEVAFLSGDWRSDYETMRTVLLDIHSGVGFDPEVDDFYPISSTHFTRSDWTKRHSDGRYQLKAPLRSSFMQRRKNDWDRILDPHKKRFLDPDRFDGEYSEQTRRLQDIFEAIAEEDSQADD